MSMTLARRALVRAVPRTRLYTTVDATGSEWVTQRAAVRAHAAETTALWRRISYYVCLPGIVVCGAWVYNAEAEHAAHTEHLKAENDGKIPQPPDYDYLNRRVKPFPWGMNALFFNAETNKDMAAAAEE